MSADRSNNQTAKTLADLALLLGPDAVEAEPVGAVTLRIDAATLNLEVDVSLARLAEETAQASELPEGWDDHSPQELRAIAAARIAALPATLEEAAREWFTNLVLWNEFIAPMSTTAFLKFLKSKQVGLHRLLGVPAVQEHIRKIRLESGAAVRRDLAQTLALAPAGRPQAVRDRRILYLEVRAIEMEPAVVAFCHLVNTKPRDTRLALRANQPEMWEWLTRKGLADAWFGSDKARGASRRGRLTPFKLACDTVARRRGMTPLSVEKMVGPIRKRREAKKASPPAE